MPKICKGDDVEVGVTIRNVGKKDGIEIAQLYIQDMVNSVKRPLKELKGFFRVRLKAGELKKVLFRISYKELSFVNESLEYLVEPVEFKIMVGPSAGMKICSPVLLKLINFNNL